MSEERAETYLRLRAEAELRRVADQLRGLDAAAGPDDRADPDMRPFATAETAQGKVVRAGRILVAAGALEEEFLALLAADLDGSIRARSRIMLNWDRRRGMLHYTMSFTPSSGPASPAGRGTAPEVDGARFALAGLSTTGGESHLHVAGSGMAPLADRYQWNWTPGFSWWLRDGTGNWHVAAAGEPHTFGDGIQAFRLRLTPPLDAVPDTAEVVVTGPATRIRATVPIRPVQDTTQA